MLQTQRLRQVLPLVNCGPAIRWCGSGAVDARYDLTHRPSRRSTVLLACFLFTAVTAANYYALRYKNRWARFESEFEAYSALVRTISGVVVAGTLVLILVGAILTKNALNHLMR